MYLMLFGYVMNSDRNQPMSLILVDRLTYAVALGVFADSTPIASRPLG